MKNLSDLREDEDEVSVSQQQENVLIVGTVFKQQERKPSILKELSEPSEDGELLIRLPTLINIIFANPRRTNPHINLTFILTS